MISEKHALLMVILGDYTLGRNGSSASQTLVEDVIVMSASQMVQMSENGSEDMVNTFVRGQSPQGHHICLDMELDHVSLAPDDLKVRVDIDSLIWVTCSLRFKPPLAVYLGPVIKEKALMHKSNHGYIDILIPQSELDSNVIRSHTEWLTMSFPLCGVSDITFGTLNNTSGSMYIYICFSRMIHRDEMTHRHANHMPKEVLDLFWGNILLPAIRQHSDVNVAPYVALTLDEVRFKARKGRKKRPGHPKVVS